MNKGLQMGIKTKWSYQNLNAFWAIYKLKRKETQYLRYSKAFQDKNVSLKDNIILQTAIYMPCILLNLIKSN